MSREVIVAANWKMHKTIKEGVNFLEAFFAAPPSSSSVTVFIAVPFTAIAELSQKSEEKRAFIGAQNMHNADSGAYTGEIAADMLVEAGACFVILGHSERRHLFGESDESINKKIKKALHSNLRPIFCVGETREEKEAGRREEVLKRQIEKGLEGIETETMKNLIVAYEPVWAIGTGLVATPRETEQVHAFCRNLLAEKGGSSWADSVVIQYGGSVKEQNAQELIALPNVDGLLIGGASLDPEGFSRIVSLVDQEVKK